MTNHYPVALRENDVLIPIIMHNFDWCITHLDMCWTDSGEYLLMTEDSYNRLKLEMAVSR
jgi:hypothetical protein